MSKEHTETAAKTPLASTFVIRVRFRIWYKGLEKIWIPTLASHSVPWLERDPV